MALRYGLLYWSYNMGTKAITAMTKYAKEFTHAASVLGVFIVGALIANYGGGTKLGISVPNGETAAEVEKLVVPVKPGRNTAMIVEVAAMNHRQKIMGYDAAIEFTKKLSQTIQK